MKSAVTLKGSPREFLDWEGEQGYEKPADIDLKKRRKMKTKKGILKVI